MSREWAKDHYAPIEMDIDKATYRQRINARNELIVIDGIAYTRLIGKFRERTLAKYDAEHFGGLLPDAEVEFVNPNPKTDPAAAPPSPIEESVPSPSVVKEIVGSPPEPIVEPETSEDESQEFISEVQPVEDDWQPSPDEWFECQISFVNAARRFIVGLLSNQQRVYIREKQIASDIGQHVFCLPPGTPVSVRMERKLGYRDFVAIEAYIPGEPITMTERGTVQSWHGNHGSLQRLCPGKCCIFGMTEKKEDFLTLPVGDLVEFDISVSMKTGGWIATNVRAVDQEVEEESEPQNAETSEKVWRF